MCYYSFSRVCISVLRMLNLKLLNEKTNKHKNWSMSKSLFKRRVLMYWGLWSLEHIFFFLVKKVGLSPAILNTYCSTMLFIPYVPSHFHVYWIIIIKGNNLNREMTQDDHGTFQDNVFWIVNLVIHYLKTLYQVLFLGLQILQPMKEILAVKELTFQWQLISKYNMKYDYKI